MASGLYATILWTLFFNRKYSDRDRHVYLLICTVITTAQCTCGLAICTGTWQYCGEKKSSDRGFARAVFVRRGMEQLCVCTAFYTCNIQMLSPGYLILLCLSSLLSKYEKGSNKML